MVKINHRSKCPICDSSNVHEISSLKDYPLTELLHSVDKKKNFPLTEIDQTFLFCSDCQHGFLGTVIDPNYLYDPSNYIFSTNKSFSGHITNFAKFINKRSFDISSCLDIGGNNSDLLDLINAKNGYVLDPNSEVSNSKKYKSIKNFYEDCNPKDFNETSITVISSHTLEHIESPDKFIYFVSQIPNFKEGFLQFPCLEMMNESGRYDLIHNQHLHYFSLHSFSRLAEKYGFFVSDFKYDRDHYGTLQIHIKKGVENKKNNLNKNYVFDAEEMITSFNNFLELSNLNNDYIEKFSEIFCYGAALMLPITFYYHPTLSKSLGILDADKEKSRIKYANIELPIIYDDLKKNISQNVICITATSTRLTHRRILSKIVDRNPRYIISPFGSI